MLILAIGMASLVFLSGCAGVELTDHEGFGSLGVEGASIFHTMTSETGTLTLEQWAARWDDLDHPLVCFGTDMLAEWKGALEKVCSHEPCTANIKQAIDNASAKIKAANDAAIKATGK